MSLKLNDSGDTFLFKETLVLFTTPVGYLCRLHAANISSATTHAFGHTPLKTSFIVNVLCVPDSKVDQTPPVFVFLFKLF